MDDSSFGNPHGLGTFELRARALLHRIDIVADEQNQTEIGELRGQLGQLATNVSDLGKDFNKSLARLADMIGEQGEKHDQRLLDAQSRVDSRFEEIAKQNLAQLSTKSSNYNANLAVGISTVLGLCGLLGTFWGLTKAPIDATFARLEAVQGHIVETTVPEKQLNRQFETLTTAVRVLEEHQRAVEVNVATVAADGKALAHEVEANRTDAKEVAKGAATKDQVAELAGRATVISERVQSIFDKNYASPKYPCLESGAGCGPVATSGPQVQPSVGGGK